jgi:hypothetical protein
MAAEKKGCQMVYFQTNYPNSGKFWSVLQCELCCYILRPFGLFSAIWYILWPFGIFCGHFGIFFPILVCCTKKNLATLLRIP